MAWCCVTLFEHAGFQGKKRQICKENSVDNVGGEWNDETSSVVAQSRGSCLFQLYEHHQRGGWQVNILCKDHDQFFDMGELQSHGFSNDALTGVYVSQSYKK
eukprot:419597_1